MKWGIAILLVLIATLTSCSKGEFTKQYPFVNLRVAAQEENIQWESTIGTWEDSTHALSIDATSFKYDQFRLRLENLTSTGTVPNLTLRNIYYTDGLNFHPTGIASGYVRITTFDTQSIKGEFSIYFDTETNGVGSKAVIGSFGVIFP